MIILVALASFVPSIILFFVLRGIKDDQDYRTTCKDMLLRGFLSTVGVFLASFLSRIIYNVIFTGDVSPVVSEVYRCFVTNALCEESMKFLFAWHLFSKKKDKLSYSDVITYLIIVAMGFGIAEDVVYAFSTSVGQILLRGFLIAHGAYGAIMGTLYASSIKKNSLVLKILAFLVPIILHGTYNFCLSDVLPEWSGGISLTLTILEFIFLIVTVVKLKKHKDDPEYNKPLYTTEQLNNEQ